LVEGREDTTKGGRAGRKDELVGEDSNSGNVLGRLQATSARPEVSHSRVKKMGWRDSTPSAIDTKKTLLQAN